MKRFSFFFLLLTFFFSSCNEFQDEIKGTGNQKTENRSAGNFKAVSVSNSFDVHLTQGPSYSVRIEADDNLLEFIDVRTEGDVLRISTRDYVDLEPSKEIKIYVSAPLFTRLKASGACDIFSDNKISSDQVLELDLSGASHAEIDLNVPKVEADLSGACSVNLKGETKDLRVHGSGATEVRCYDLRAENVDVDLSGAGNAEVYASVSLKAGLSGAGSVTYRGNPTVTQNVSGAGSISKAD